MICASKTPDLIFFIYKNFNTYKSFEPKPKEVLGSSSYSSLEILLLNLVLENEPITLVAM